MVSSTADEPQSGTHTLKVTNNYVLISERLPEVNTIVTLQINHVCIGLVNQCIAVGVTNIQF